MEDLLRLLIYNLNNKHDGKETIGPVHDVIKLGLSPNLNSYELHKRVAERLRKDIELRIQELNNKHDE